MEKPKTESGNAPRPRVSLGVPVFNGENYLEEALDSLLAQTFEDFELIISDNASTDGTEEISREYAARDNRIRYLRHPENRGIAWNYNQAFLAARGEYFKWCCHDDICHPTFLERSVEVLNDDPSIGACYSKVSLIDGAGNWIGLVDQWHRGRSRNLVSEKAHRRFGDVLMHCVCAAEMYGLIRSDILHAGGLYRPYCLAEKVLIAELALLGKVYEIPEPLLSWRQHAEQYTQVESCKERAAATNPAAHKWFSWPYRAQSTMGYLAIVLRAKLGFVETSLCLLVFLRYLLQVGKWRQVIAEALTGKTTWFIPVDRSAADTPAKRTLKNDSRSQVTTAS